MAFASVGGLGSNNSKVASSTITLAPTSNVPAGHLVVVWSAWDAHGPSGGSTSGNSTPRYVCHDTAGNIYTQLGGHEDSDTTRPAFLLFVSQLRNALATTDTITVSYINATPVAKGITAWEFTLANAWANADKGNTRVTTLGADPAAISVSGMDSQEYLLLHVLSAKGPSTDAYTWDADYTQVGTGGTTGGTDTSNCTVTGGYRIATLTGDTVDVTSTTADRNYLQGLYALCQVTVPTFPTTPILDSFTRADENPLDNGTWDATGCQAAGSHPLQLLSNQVGTSGGFPGGQWWLTQNAVNDAEVYATQPVKPGATGITSGFGVLLHASGCSQSSTRSGYEGLWTYQGGTFDQVYLGAAGNSVNVDSGLTWRSGVANANGVKVGLVKIGSTVFLFLDLNGGVGWEQVAAAYYTSFVRTSGKMGLDIGDTTARCDDFGGGPHVSLAPHTLPYLGVGA